ncbi:hypothetical protein DW768_15185, partial [Ruminococcus sp. AM29-26]
YISDHAKRAKTDNCGRTDFESHHSGEWEPYIPVIQSHLIGLCYIYFLYTVNTHLWCEYR